MLIFEKEQRGLFQSKTTRNASTYDFLGKLQPVLRESACTTLREIYKDMKNTKLTDEIRLSWQLLNNTLKDLITFRERVILHLMGQTAYDQSWLSASTGLFGSVKVRLHDMVYTRTRDQAPTFTNRKDAFDQVSRVDKRLWFYDLLDEKTEEDYNHAKASFSSLSKAARQQSIKQLMAERKRVQKTRKVWDSLQELLN